MSKPINHQIINCSIQEKHTHQSIFFLLLSLQELLLKISFVMWRQKHVKSAIPCCKRLSTPNENFFSSPYIIDKKLLNYTTHHIRVQQKWCDIHLVVKYISVEIWDLERSQVEQMHKNASQVKLSVYKQIIFLSFFPQYL